MRAAVVNVFGEAPKFGEFRDPEPVEGETTIRVRAAGLHQLVRGLASGTHYASGSELPMAAGVDGVGELEDGGGRVYFVFVRRPWGTMAERAAARRATCVPVPDGLSDVQAAALANPGMSAWMSLKERAGLETGETVLVMGATGVAGQMAIQVARALGAKRVVGAGRNVEALEGADVDGVIALGDGEDAVREALAAEAAGGIDVVIDYLWGRPTEMLLEALAKGFSATKARRTRLVEVGAMAGRTITLPAEVLRSIDLTLMGSGFGASPLDKILASIPGLFRMAAEGKLKVAAEAVPLEQVEEAWGWTDKGKRIVFTV
jgi:NADPH:quinone reductase-like Zn-dependent oxidoreductase